MTVIPLHTTNYMYSIYVHEHQRSPHLILLGVAWHRDARGPDGRQVWTDLIEAECCLHSLLSTMHQHLLELGERGQKYYNNSPQPKQPAISYLKPDTCARNLYKIPKPGVPCSHTSCVTIHVPV